MWAYQCAAFPHGMPNHRHSHIPPRGLSLLTAPRLYGVERPPAFPGVFNMPPFAVPVITNSHLRHTRDLNPPPSWMWHIRPAFKQPATWYSPFHCPTGGPPIRNHLWWVALNWEVKSSRCTSGWNRTIFRGATPALSTSPRWRMCRSFPAVSLEAGKYKSLAYFSLR